MLARRRARAVVVPTVASCAAHMPLVLVLVRRVVVVSVVSRTDVVVHALFVVLLVRLLHLLVLVFPLFFFPCTFCQTFGISVQISSHDLGSSLAPSGCTCWCSWAKLQLFPFLQWPFWKNLQISFPIFSSYFTSVYRSGLPTGFAQPSDVFW